LARQAHRQQRRVTGRRREAQGVLGHGLRDAADDVHVDHVHVVDLFVDVVDSADYIVVDLFVDHVVDSADYIVVDLFVDHVVDSADYIVVDLFVDHVVDHVDDRGADHVEQQRDDQHHRRLAVQHVDVHGSVADQRAAQDR
jgi:hypothetical protein